MNKAQLSWIIGIIGGLIAMGTGAKTFWHDFGWITPAQAESEHMAGEQKILDAIEDLQEQQQNTRDEWKCDEYDEELRDLRRLLNRLEEGTDEYVETAYDIERIENKMERINCSRFEDWG